MSGLIVLAVVLLVSIALFIFTGYTSSFLAEHISESAAIRAAEAAERPQERPAILDRIGRPFKGRVPAAMAKKAEQYILYAGHPYDLKSEDICGLMVIGCLVGLWGGIMVANLMHWSFLLAIPLGLIGAGYPWLWLRDLVKKRHLHIVRDLPFNIDLLTLAVEAGLDFAAGVAKMVEKGKPGPVRDEFKIMLSQMRMGKSRAEAMHDMAERVGLPALNSFLSVLIQADRLGTGLGKVLRIQADQMRMERSQRAEKTAAQAPVKMLLPLVGFIFPTIWFILAGPLVFTMFFNK